MRLAPTAAISLWTATIAYIPVSGTTPDIWPWGAPLQRLALGGAILFSLIWWLDRRADEHRTGYLLGLRDRRRDQRRDEDDNR